MPKFTIEKKIPFEAGHRLIKYEGKCKNCHGHNYICYVGLESDSLNESGMVLDFRIIKENCESFIKENLDHATIVNIHDTEYIKSLQKMKMKIYIIDGNPTAEIIAKHLYNVFTNVIPYIKYVKIEETPDSIAIYEGE